MLPRGAASRRYVWRTRRPLAAILFLVLAFAAPTVSAACSTRAGVCTDDSDVADANQKIREIVEDRFSAWWNGLSPTARALLTDPVGTLLGFLFSFLAFIVSAPFIWGARAVDWVFGQLLELGAAGGRLLSSPFRKLEAAGEALPAFASKKLAPAMRAFHENLTGFSENFGPLSPVALLIVYGSVIAIVFAVFYGLVRATMRALNPIPGGSPK